MEKSRDEWCKVFDGSDACFAPVLTFSEARAHPHNVARKTFTRAGKVDQPAPGAALLAHAWGDPPRAARARRRRRDRR